MNRTVPGLSILFMACSAAIAVFLPLVLFLFLRRKKGAGVAPLLVGAASFLLFALVLESAAHGFVFANDAAHAFLRSQPWIYALYVGLMAGLFEESGRLVSFYFVLRRHNSIGDALAYGVGHGGLEAILLVGVTMLNNLVLSIMIRVSGLEHVTAMFSQNPAALQGVQALVGTDFILFLAGGLERIIALAFHLAASVLVWMAATGRGPWGLYFLAILFHACLNFPAGLYQFGLLQNVWLLELLTALLALAACLVTKWIYDSCSKTYTPLLRYAPPKP